MKRPNVQLITILVLTFYGLSCKKSGLDCYTAVMPSITTIGANTLACRWNGEIWTNQREAPQNRIDSTIYGDYFNGGNGLILNGNLQYEDDCNTVDQRIVMVFDIITKDSIANFQIRANDWSIDPTPGIIAHHYYMDPSQPFNHKVLRFSTEDRIYSAEFHGVLIDTVANETLRIEDGRIDVKI